MYQFDSKLIHPHFPTNHVTLIVSFHLQQHKIKRPTNVQALFNKLNISKTENCAIATLSI